MKLIEIAKKCSTNPGFEYCEEHCPFFKDDDEDEDGSYLCVNALLTALTGGFEMAYEDLKRDELCHTCIHYDYIVEQEEGHRWGYQNTDKHPCDKCYFGNSHWKWRGDK